jgi:hypothetical protein
MKLTYRTFAMTAAVAALMGFSAGVATKPQQQKAASAQESVTPVYQDASLAGLSVAQDAEVDLDPGKLYY